METAAIIGIILSAVLGAAGLAINSRQTKKANQAQMEHDQAMAALNHRYREQEAATSFEREATFNQFGSDVQKMQSAGLSPALMYGQSMGSSVPSVSSVGSSQSAGNVGKTFNASDFFGKLDPSEYAEQAIQRMNARTMAEKTRSDIALQGQYQLESLSRTLENQRNTAFKKNLERTLFDIEQENLRGLKIGNEQADFNLQFAKDTRDIQVEKQQLQNVELRKKVDLISEQIRSEPVRRAQLATDIQRIVAATDNYYANTANVQESTRSSQVGRIMQEFGLNFRKLPANLRAADIEHGPWREQMKSARLALLDCGFSEYEATAAVLYYTASNPKDVTPSLVNGASRVLSAFAK